jgi:integrase/recombinase XerD
MVMSKETRPATPPSFAALVQTFFAEHLTQQRALSPCTVAAYRDAFVLFLDFAQTRLGKSPVAIKLADITPELVLAFLDHLEHERHNTVRSRNARLAALRGLPEVRRTSRCVFIARHRESAWGTDEAI